MTVPEHLANRDVDSSILEPVAEPPARAQVVIVGGGIIGSSIAYHLTKLGVTDVLVLERARLTAGRPGTPPGWSPRSAGRTR